MLPKDAQLQTSATHLLEANGTRIPLLGELEVKFRVAGRQYALVTGAVDKFILGIDFLWAEACQWDFGGGRILLGSSWVRLQKQDSGNQVRRIYVAEDYHVPPGVQSDVPVSVTWPNLRTGSNDWVAEPKKMADGVIAARTLFSGEALQLVMRVINLSDELYNLRKNEHLGEATQAEIWTSGFDTATMPVPSRNASLAGRAGPDAGPLQNVSGGADSVHTIDQESNDVCAVSRRQSAF